MFAMSERFQERELEQPRVAAASAGSPPPPHNPPVLARQAAASKTQPRVQYALAAAAPNPPPPPDDPQDERKWEDPNRRYGGILSVSPGPEFRVQYYSYLSEVERLGKVQYLRDNPDREHPIGDPMCAPDDRNVEWGFVIKGQPRGKPEGEIYWYDSDAMRNEVLRRIYSVVDKVA